MSYLIDSDVVIDYLIDRAQTVDLISDLRRSGIALSVITYMEVAEGIAAGSTPEQATRGLRRIMRGSRMLVVSRAIADRAARVRLDLRRRKRPVDERALDILIAATAIEHNLILVTRNTRDYEDIPGLRLYESGQTEQRL